MAQLNDQARVLEEWFRLPESRRRDATDAVAFAFRFLQEQQPELTTTDDDREVDHERIVAWLLPHLTSSKHVS